MTPAQKAASQRNWLLRNIVGFAEVLRRWRVPMADPLDDADLNTAIEALERINARRKARYVARWQDCAPCAGSGWEGGPSGLPDRVCSACFGKGRTRRPKETPR